VANNVNVVNRGFEYVAQWMAGNYGSAGGKFTLPTVIGWGNANGSNATSVVLPSAGPSSTQGTGQWYDVGPYREFTTEARVVAASTAVTGNALASGTVTTSFVGTITASTNHNTQGSNAEAGSVGESFLVFSTSVPAEFYVNSAVTAAATSLTVTTGTLTNNAYYQLNNEVIQITAVSSNTIASTIVRARNGSSANSAATNDGLMLGNIPGTTGNTTGDLFAHAGFVSLALNSGDSIQFTWQISVTS
jgi:hypothetical protein